MRKQQPPIPTEHEEQVALFDWAKRMEPFYPELKELHAIPNGGLRSARTAAMLQREGVKAGVPDICLPVPRNGKHGLYIELKRRARWKLSEAQAWWLDRLARDEYVAAVCVGWDQARDTILEYLRSEENDEAGVPAGESGEPDAQAGAGVGGEAL